MSDIPSQHQAHEPLYGVNYPPRSLLDLDRERRTGDPEVVFGPGKSPTLVVQLLTELRAAHPRRAVMATRLTAEALFEIESHCEDVRIDTAAGTACLGPLPEPHGTVAIVTAGAADAPVAREAAVTVRVFGAQVEMIADVGVAGLHRLLSVQDRIARADVAIVVAGLEGALPSVVGGLVGIPTIGVPTSVGYGVSSGGLAALLAMLNSCAPGVVVVNIDNGFGAGVHAARIARRGAAEL